jgi:hypothetical protein
VCRLDVVNAFARLAPAPMGHDCTIAPYAMGHDRTLAPAAEMNVGSRTYMGQEPTFGLAVRASVVS